MLKQAILCFVVLFCCFQVINSKKFEFGISNVSGSTDITFTLKNLENATSQFTFVGTPFGEFYTKQFIVYDENKEEVEYLGRLGRLVKHLPKETYLSVGPFEEISTTFSIKGLYKFQKGEYTVLLNLPDIEGHFQDSIYSNRYVTVNIKEEIFYKEEAPEETFGNSYTNCNTVSQKNTVDSATSAAITDSNSSKNCLNLGTCTSRSQTWFGSTKPTTDINCFTKVYDRLNNYGVNAYCYPSGCSLYVYAYVYPSDPSYTVYLCNLFFTIADEQTQTIIHESSHFTKLCGSQDYAYGVAECKALAVSNPNKAQNNADNIGYFGIGLS
eukprot:TRINITY_DN14452_c0_g1_i1.p1 TRINITY_DN14452_c0_g1~~TRINITY_DN14452_c0_g1_i1.p1  ORF type:complete len:326 (+),score=94.99 TRINITY_DN14452_c0_g1_i1:1113-2090(+)